MMAMDPCPTNDSSAGCKRKRRGGGEQVAVGSPWLWCCWDRKVVTTNQAMASRARAPFLHLFFPLGQRDTREAGEEDIQPLRGVRSVSGWILVADMQVMRGCWVIVCFLIFFHLKNEVRMRSRRGAQASAEPRRTDLPCLSVCSKRSSGQVHFCSRGFCRCSRNAATRQAEGLYHVEQLRRRQVLSMDHSSDSNVVPKADRPWKHNARRWCLVSRGDASFAGALVRALGRLSRGQVTQAWHVHMLEFARQCGSDAWMRHAGEIRFGPDVMF